MGFPQRRSTTPALTTSSGGDVTVALTGVVATCAAGLLGVALALGLTGAASAAGVGTATASTSIGITGSTSTGSAGTLAPSATKALTGVSSAGASGTVAPDTSAALTGAAATGSAGVTSGGQPLTGVSATGSVGTVTPSTTRAVTGNAATGAVGTLAPSLSVPGAPIYRDDFNRADENPISGAWTCEVLSSPPLPAAWGQSELSSGKVWGLGPNSNPVYYNTAVGADCFVQAKAYGTPWPGVFARLQPGAGTAYFFMWPNSHEATLYRFVGGSDFTALLDFYQSSNPLVDGDTLRLEVEGTGATVTLRLYKNSVLINTYADTDANRIVAPGKVGIHTDGIHAAGLDDFEAGALTSAGLGGVIATGQVGTPTASVTVALSGVSATGAVGTLAPSSTLALTGTTGTGGVGSVTASGGGGGNVTVALTGVSATATPGSMTASTSAALNGVSGAGAAGSLAPQTALALSGVPGTGAVGTVAPQVARAISGVSATGAAGSAVQSSTVALTGVQVIGRAGSVTPSGGDPPVGGPPSDGTSGFSGFSGVMSLPVWGGGY